MILSSEEDKPFPQKVKPATEEKGKDSGYSPTHMILPSSHGTLFRNTSSFRNGSRNGFRIILESSETTDDSEDSEGLEEIMNIMQLLMSTSTGSNEQQTYEEMGEPSSPIIEEPLDAQWQPRRECLLQANSWSLVYF